MNHSLKTRVLSMVLAVVMVIGLVPMSVFATEAENESTTPEIVIVKFDVNGGKGEYEDQTVVLGEKITKPEDPTHDSAMFAYWTADLEKNEEWDFEENVVETAENGEMTLYASWITPAADPVPTEPDPIPTETNPAETAPVPVEYKVEHYLETAEGYVLDERATETMTGEVGAATNAAAKTYEGYTANPFDQGIIAADGTTVVAIYYSANPVVADAAIGGGLESLGMTVITDKESTLAPGVTMNEIVLYDKNGERVEMQMTTSDTNVDTVKFYANFKDNDVSLVGKSAMQTLSEQVAAIEANYEEPFKVVAGLNASYYNTTTGAPTGAFVMEGVDASTTGDSYAFFAVLKDGTVMIGNKGEYSKYKGQIKEAIGGYQHIVVDGAVASGLDKTTKYPRQTIGITADGKVITMTADGSQAPKTVGLTIQEQAEVMLALGCVDALHLDGGNSATFGAVREGTDKFVTVNSPSGGAERAVSNTLMIVSTAVPDGAFDHAVITSDYDYFVPHTSYTFDAFGVDAANGAAEIPETAVWTLSDDNFGTIAADGTFTSTGKLGNVDIQLTANGKVIGAKTISIVTPTSISFAGAETTIPYGKSAELPVTAMYGNNEALCDADSYNWTVDPAEAGTMEGFSFTAANESNIASAVVTAAYKHAEGVENASITVKFGKGSEVLFDFEDGDISDWRGTETINEWIDAKNAENPDAAYALYKPQDYSNGIGTQSSSVFLASEENGGHVKNGEYSLGFRMNHLNVDGIGSWVYNYLYYTGETKVLRDVAAGKAGVRLGMWVYSPDITNVAFRLVRGTEAEDGKKGLSYTYMKSLYDEQSVSYATNYGIPEAGWIYVYYDLTDLQDTLRQTTSRYDPDKNNNASKVNANYYPAFLQLFTGSATDTMEDMIFYIDDITLDYSDVTDDRDAPVISNIMVSTDGANDVALNGQTVTTNLLSFSANVADTAKANATGLNYSSAKIYVDGVDMSHKSFRAAGGIMSLSNVNLTNGTHSIAFVIFDNQGNETRVTKTLTVKGAAANAEVYLAGHNDGNNTPEAGSVYYIDVKASDAAQISAISTTLKLNTANTFEYEHIICADGVTATASYDALDHELTLNIDHDGTQTGETVLVSVPVRVWAWNEAATGITAAAQFASGAIPVINIECETTLGKVTYADGAYADYVAGFHTAMDVATKLDNESAWHTHNAAAIDDKAADCTHDGYTGRTYCDGCKSVVAWGTTVSATGHTYELTDSVLKCACGVTFTGIWEEDGKEYVDGICMADGWYGDAYYKDGVKLTGIQKVPAPDSTDEFYYDFGTVGICEKRVKYEGIFLDTAENVYRYSKLGVLSSGWFVIEDEWYYFVPETMAAATGTFQYTNDIVYEFAENGKLTKGYWAKTLYGTKYYYGPSCYGNGWVEIDGKQYYFEDYHRMEGYRLARGEGSMILTWYNFGEDGALIEGKVPDGFHMDGKHGLAYVRDGVGVTGEQVIDGVYYGFNWKGYAQTGEFAGRLYGDDYKAVTGIVEKADGLYYYLNGKPNMAGLVKIDGDYYFAAGDGKIITDQTYYVWQGNGYVPESNREFGADGKMLDGIVEKDGSYYYYNMGKPEMAGLVEVDGYYYFAKDGNGKLITNQTYYVWKGNGIVPESDREFGPDGKMLNGIVEKEGKYYYYDMGQPKMAGLVYVDGAYYFARNAAGEVITNQTYYVWLSNGWLPEGNYQFGADGRMIDGIVEIDGSYYYYENGKPKMAGLIEIDGAYYFAAGDGKIITDQTYYVWQGNGYVPESNREFGADGKMLNGIIEKNGSYYYYELGKPEMAGLIEIDGDYYFAKDGNGKLITNQTYYVWKGNGIVPESDREFGSDGKLLNGIVEKNGNYYYYNMGKPEMAGLIKIDGDYYFAKDASGTLVTNQIYYVWKTNGNITESEREFGADGKMLNGFVTKEDGIYYYEDGKTGTVGLNYIDGYYYFVGYDGKLVTNRTYYVWKTNGLTVEMNYTFDAQGRIVL